MSDLAQYIQTSPLADTHEHVFLEEPYVHQGLDVLTELFAGAYTPADLRVAGVSREQVRSLVDDTQVDVRTRFESIRPQWEVCKYTGYGEGVRRAARRVYGIEELTAESLAGAAARNAEIHQPGQRLHLLRDVAHLAYIVADYATWETPPDASGPEFFFRDLSWFGFCNGEVDAAKLHAATGVEVRDLESLRAAMTRLFELHAPTALSIKAQHAYCRTLAWQQRDESDVRRMLARTLAGVPLTEAERCVLGDWCWARGVELGIQHNLPFKLHTGYHAGDSTMVLDWVRPANLCRLLLAYPEARFVLMHSGYPYTGEILALAKQFPNVYLDLCWAWSIDPRGTAEFVRRFIHTVPASRLFVFGGDAATPTQTVGYAEQCRHWLTRALTQEVADGDLTERDALDLAGRIMHENQAACFDLAGTRAALRAAQTAVPVE